MIPHLVDLSESLGFSEKVPIISEYDGGGVTIVFKTLLLG